jgi:hypothetical protein
MMAMLDVVTARIREETLTERVREVTAECDRLHGLLSIARDGLRVACSFLTTENENGGTARAVVAALRNSDPDTSSEDV